MLIKFRYRLFIFILFLLSVSANAQEYYTYHGLLLDSATQKPIPFAHIKLGQDVSVSNQNGYFSIRYGANKAESVVKFSCVGYRSKELILSVLLSSNVATLAQDVQMLREIVISRLTAQDILKKAEKNGFKNYSTSKYSAKYIFDQFVFFEGADSSIATSREIGILTNKGLDTTATYPRFTHGSKQVSNRFLEFDTISNPLTPLTKAGNTITVETAYSFDPIRIGLLKQFHPVPTIFSKGFYETTNLNILSIVRLDDKEYYLISVFPKEEKPEATLTKEELKQIELYKKQIKEVALKSGRSISDNQIDSIFSLQPKKGKPSMTSVAGFFLVDVRTYGIAHALIKVNTFDQAGNLFAKLHVSASYNLARKRYYLQNMDILMKRTSPGDFDNTNLYYLISLGLSNFQGERTSSTDQLSGLKQLQAEKEPLMNLSVRNIEHFIAPTKDCASCKSNPLILFGQMFD